MGHEVGDALEHAARLEDERREGDLVEIHADSGARGIGQSRLEACGGAWIGEHTSAER